MRSSGLRGRGRRFASGSIAFSLCSIFVRHHSKLTSNARQNVSTQPAHIGSHRGVPSQIVSTNTQPQER
jgi:hypothetical protein